MVAVEGVAVEGVTVEGVAVGEFGYQLGPPEDFGSKRGTAGGFWVGSLRGNWKWVLYRFQDNRRGMEVP